MNARNVHRKVLRVRRLIRAFTLVEMLICVGAVALIAVGLGKLFSSTGDTVKVGKRLSYFNEVATTLENRIRRDLASATRDGPLVIRHKVITSTGPGGGVLLSPNDRNPNPTTKRADEIVFLANGKFTSNREPQWPGRSPSSTVARISIGHGMVWDASDALTTPQLTDDPEGAAPAPARAWPAELGAVGPNQYASDWILLRHVTVLQRPQTSENTQGGSSAFPIAVAGGQPIPTTLTPQNWPDSPSQIALQPAAPSVFRFDPVNLGQPDRLGHGYQNWPNTAVAPTPQPLDPPLLSQWARDQEISVGWPQTIGGLVDVVSMDPQMIRTRILGVPGLLPRDAGHNAQKPAKLTITPNTQLEAANNAPHLAKMLMAGMLPGADPWIYQNGAIATPREPIPGGNKREQRMICAPKPPDFTGSLGGTMWPPNQPYRQQDQAMLSASNLVVGCSEFKIEWSFGDVYPLIDDAGNSPPNANLTSRVGQIIWHGRDAGNALPGEFSTAPYRGSQQHIGIIPSSGDMSVGYDAYYQRWVPSNSTTGVSKRRQTTVGPAGLLPFPARLVHWPVSVVDPNFDLTDDVPLYSFFGYIDPTFRPTSVNGVQVDPDTLEWPWPKLIRFTIGLTDPTDPTFEQIYQFIVEVPAANTQQ